jgi:hypothetical protein
MEKISMSQFPESTRFTGDYRGWNHCNLRLGFRLLERPVPIVCNFYFAMPMYHLALSHSFAAGRGAVKMKAQLAPQVLTSSQSWASRRSGITGGVLALSLGAFMPTSGCSGGHPGSGADPARRVTLRSA